MCGCAGSGVAARSGASGGGGFFNTPWAASFCMAAAAGGATYSGFGAGGSGCFSRRGRGRQSGGDSHAARWGDGGQGKRW